MKHRFYFGFRSPPSDMECGVKRRFHSLVGRFQRKWRAEFSNAAFAKVKAALHAALQIAPGLFGTTRAICCIFLFSAIHCHAAETTRAEIKNLSINGGIEDGKARFIIETALQNLGGDSQKLLFSTALEHRLQVTREKLTHTINATFEILQGDPRELALTLNGDAEIKSVTGEQFQDWSVRQETNGVRSLVLRPRKSDKPLTQLTAKIIAERPTAVGAAARPLLSLSSPFPALLHGYLRIDVVPEIEFSTTNSVGLVPIETKFLPEALRPEIKPDEPAPLAFRFQGAAYSLTAAATLSDPDARRVVLRDFQLQGRLANESAEFTLSATAVIKNPRGGTLIVLSGDVALANLETNPDWRIQFRNGQFFILFSKPGEYPLRLKFNATVHRSNAWNQVSFGVAPAAVAPIILDGLAADTQFEFIGAAKPERVGNQFRSFLPGDGAVNLAWKEAATEAEGKLFYAAQMHAQITISPGLMRQTAIIEGKVMQGELNRVVLLARGRGSVTAVQGANILSWNLEGATNADERRIVVRFNQAQKDTFALTVQMQSELAALPQSFDAMQLRPEGATRFAGHVRIVNEGAVRVEVLQASGLSQISPEQFPETETTKAQIPATGNQRFVFRFSNADYTLRIQADNVLPEISVSQLLAYHLGETELAIDSEFELEIREAPVREVLLRTPKGYSIARLNAAGLSDYFLRDLPDTNYSELRLVYSQPIADRQIIQLRLERNAALGQATWALPRVEVIKTKSTRGHIAVSSDPGFRITPERTAGLTDIATAFFPRKINGIQAAFRLTDPAWEATLRVERLPQSIQADVLHLFSIGEGIAYGSSTLNFFISGAPVSSFLVALSDEYFNVEFTGKDLRPNWQKTTNGFVVTLNTPVSGAYTLLVTYERPFKAQGDTLTFTGARPVDAQSEQGHTIVVSAYQYRVNPVTVSPGLLPLETAEVPAEYRLFFDAPILTAYRYTARPFNLQLALSPLAQGETVGLVVDRAAFNTKISKDGEVVTSAQYFVKNRGNPNLRLKLPSDATLWSARVNGVTVVPVKDGDDNLIRLQQFPDPNTVQTLEIKIASRSKTPERVIAAAPIVAAPVLLAEWKIEPDANQKLIYRDGTLAPAHGLPDASGFAAFLRLLLQPREARMFFAFGLALVFFALFACRWGARGAHSKPRRLGGAIVGLSALLLAAMQFFAAWNNLDHSLPENPRELTFLAPVQQSGSALVVEVANVTAESGAGNFLSFAWPAIFALLAWGYTFIRGRDWFFRPAGFVLGWTLLAWATLRAPDGLPWFLILLAVFLLAHVIVPSLRALFTTPRIAVAALAIVCCTPSISAQNARAESISQSIRIQDQFAFGSARIKWHATKNQTLPLIYDPAVLTGITYPTNALKLSIATTPRRGSQLIAQQDGVFDIELRYQVRVVKKENESGFTLPTEPALVNQLTLVVNDLDVDVLSTNAVSVTRSFATNTTTANVILAPASDSWIAWRPRSRDVSREKAEFFADLAHLFVPAAGVIEGVHQIQIRPAQGEIAELSFEVPAGATITDVNDAAKLVSLWRFDPDTRKLRVTLSAPQSRPFGLIIRSQVATGPLPFEQTIGLITVSGAAGQLGSVGLATGNEVQLDSVTPENLTPINLEDFSTTLAVPPDLAATALRRAFRYTGAGASLAIKASAVEPDVRVETAETLSLGEDRITLAIAAEVAITRAGIFRLSFALPPALDVETISGAAMSHWTELKNNDARIITLHLKGKTEGPQQFNISLSGPGTKGQTNYSAPRVLIREASKQRGQLTIVPDQGMRLQVSTRDGVTQLDPQKAGIRQKGVLAFRLLQSDWKLTLDLEQVNAWIQAQSLQHTTVTEAQIKTSANLQYQIENTGVKSFHVLIPTNAESIRFRGDQVADFLPVPGGVTNQLQTWEVKLHRRMLGKYLLQATWQTPLAPGATNFTLHGVQALDANLQRGFVTLQASGRLQIRADSAPAALQAAEWQSIPRPLRQDIEAATANYTFRLVEPAFQFTIALERHEATKLLPARVNSVTLTSVISDEGVMLTQARLELIPGDKRLLHLTLPKSAQFWFAFVNQNGVYPWRENDQILVPLEQQSRSDKPTTVELFFSSKIGAASHRKLNLALEGPKFDLPLENITWDVFLNDKWKIKKWSGTLQLQNESDYAQPVAIDVQSYLSNEVFLNTAKTKEAEQMLNFGNTLLLNGDPTQARRALQNAYNLSVHDNAFNEDARVQLHNLKLQQALVGLNVRQSAVGGETTQAPANVQNLRARKDAAYTQQEAKQFFDSNTAEDNAALTRLAERLVQQQDAAVAAPASIRATIPQQGRQLTFKRAVQVDTWTDLTLQLQATPAHPAGGPARFLILASIFAAFALLALLAKTPKQTI